LLKKIEPPAPKGKKADAAKKGAHTDGPPQAAPEPSTP
jgi:hypothetical protein